MLLRFGHVLTLLAMFSVIGGHWTLLQTVAWAGMLVDNAQSSSLVVAVQDTFSGEKPCGLCHAVEEGRKQERNLPAAIQIQKKLDGFLTRAAERAPEPPSIGFSYPRLTNADAIARHQTPPAPVPISALRA